MAIRVVEESRFLFGQSNVKKYLNVSALQKKDGCYQYKASLMSDNLFHSCLLSDMEKSLRSVL